MAPGGGASTWRPSSQTAPAVDPTSPAMIWSRVDFPHPDGPMMETKLPRSMSRSTPLSATVVVPPGAAKALHRPQTRRNDRGASVIAGRSGQCQHALRDVDRRLEPPVFAHQLHGAGGLGHIYGGPELRQQHLVLERRVEVGELLIDVARGGLVGIGEGRALDDSARELLGRRAVLLGP